MRLATQPLRDSLTIHVEKSALNLWMVAPGRLGRLAPR